MPPSSSLRRERKPRLEDLEKGLGIERDKLLWAIENLKAAGLVRSTKKEKAKNTLTEEGLGYLNSMPEERLAERRCGKAGEA